MFSDMIILIPGIGGSRLQRENGSLVYDLTLKGLPKLLWNWAEDELVYTGGIAPPDDGIVATDLFNNQIFPSFFGVDDYDGLYTKLQEIVHSPDEQVLKFPYDWRASNRWAAEKLDTFARQKLHTWRKQSGKANAKLWLVCHSMGGLVARYFCEHLGGAEITCQMITIGTPHRGSPKALDALVNGMKFGLLNFSQVVRSFPSVYELLPQFPVVSLGECTNEPLARVGDFFGIHNALPLPNGASPSRANQALQPLPNVNPEMLTAALAFHAAIRSPVVKRMNNGEATPYDMHCFFNRRQPTVQMARWVDGNLIADETSPSSSGETKDEPYERGDGTVPGFAAVPIEWADTSNAVVVNEKHAMMPSAKAVADMIYNLAHPLDAREMMGGSEFESGTIGLGVPPFAKVDESFQIRLDAIIAADVNITLENLSEGTQTYAKAHVPAHHRREIEFSISKEGSYAIHIQPSDRSRPSIVDYVVVIANA